MKTMKVGMETRVAATTTATVKQTKTASTAFKSCLKITN
jgi:hypothetical protein